MPETHDVVATYPRPDPLDPVSLYRITTDACSYRSAYVRVSPATYEAIKNLAFELATERNFASQPGAEVHVFGVPVVIDSDVPDTEIHIAVLDGILPR
jgi:hypothetical protein